jgi:hypothetical protein
VEEVWSGEAALTGLHSKHMGKWCTLDGPMKTHVETERQRVKVGLPIQGGFIDKGGMVTGYGLVGHFGLFVGVRVSGCHFEVSCSKSFQEILGYSGAELLSLVGDQALVSYRGWAEMAFCKFTLKQGW